MKHADHVSALAWQIAMAPRPALFSALREALPAEQVKALGLAELAPVVARLAAHAQAVPVGGALDEAELTSLRDAAEVLTLIRAEFPNAPQLYYAEVLVRRRLAEPERTLAIAREGAERFPHDWACIASLANALRDARQPVAALDYARRAVTLDPNDGSPLFDAAWAFMDVGRSSEAAEIFADLLKRHPSYPGAAEALRIARDLRPTT